MCYRGCHALHMYLMKLHLNCWKRSCLTLPLDMLVTYHGGDTSNVILALTTIPCNLAILLIIGLGYDYRWAIPDRDRWIKLYTLLGPNNTHGGWLVVCLS